MGIRDKMLEKLTQAFAPDFIELVDESEKHKGHANYVDGKSTHFHLTISSPLLSPLSRVAQHRAIMDALGEEFANGLHALRIEVIDKHVC
ncbi:MAG TPA: BolA family transcriptional regulator [Devosia sp.]|nr:BolA family transcriptional regulator [Devosia sp.]